MSSNNKYANTTSTYGTLNRNLDGVIFSPAKPVLDSELNLFSDISSGRLQDTIRSMIPSGWLDADYDMGFDENYETYSINTTLEPNTFYLNSKKQTPTIAVVNGWILQIGGTGLLDKDFANKITLGPAVNNREDLVFLEVWKSPIFANTLDGKPDVNKLWKYGNTSYGGVNLDDEIINSSVGFETTTRTQIQYRIRVISNVDFEGHPEGLSDSSNVFARGGGSTASNYPFINAKDSLDDSGLYVAGDGSDSSRNILKSVDGYVYAIPMMRINRRNKTTFSTLNLNGARFSLTEGVTSDRPDGLFYDQVHEFDIEDLRHSVSFDKFNYQALLEESFDKLLSGKLDTNLQRAEGDPSLRRTNIGFLINKIASSTGSGTTQVTQPNGQQRYFSDVSKTILVTQKYTVTNKIIGVSGGNWVSSDVISIEVRSPSPTGTVIGSNSPVAKFKYTNIISGDVISPVVGELFGGGTGSATYVLGDNSSSGLTNQDIYVTYEITYPQKGNKLTKPITDILKVQDVALNKTWGFLSVNDVDLTLSPSFPYRRETLVPPRETLSKKDYAYTYSIQSPRNYKGVGTLISYFMQGNGSQDYTIPGSLINQQDAEYVLAAYDVDNTAPQFMDLVSVVRNTSNYSIDVSLPYTIPVGRTVRFDIVVSGGILEYDERTQSIVDMGKVDWYEIQGNGTTSVVLKGCLFNKDPDDIVIGAQTEFFNGNYEDACYVNNYRDFVNITIDSDTSMVHLNFTNNVSSGSVIRIALLTKKTLSPGDNLDIYYNYKEYKGITAKTNFGTSSTSFINSKILYHDNKLRIITSGTGALLNPATSILPKEYENCISLLPLKDSVDGEFTGTVYNERPVKGGSYAIESQYKSPYKAGYPNTMTKVGVTQSRGTYKGGQFTSVAEAGEGSVHKLVVAPLLEMVLKDGTNNFIPGEVALKVETNYLIHTTTNRITNFSSSEMNNNYDMFKIKGRPLIKKLNK